MTLINEDIEIARNSVRLVLGKTYTMNKVDNTVESSVRYQIWDKLEVVVHRQSWLNVGNSVRMTLLRR
jgi:hypothetical protein